MSELATLFQEAIAAGLQRKSINTCSKWAENYRIMGGQDFPGPWRFRYHPWLKGMHDSDVELNVGQKAAQMGYTETILNVVLYNMDVKHIDCLYVLPAKTPDAANFSAGRFNPALELSPHLTKVFSDVKNVGHKRAGTTNLYIRGSRSRSGLKSVPTGLIVLDELDEMTEKNVPLAMERAAGQLTKRVWMVSTATIDNRGINKYFRKSSQNHFYFKCPSCSRFTELIYPESFVVTGEDLEDPNLKNSHYICKECKAKLPHETKVDWLNHKNQWVPSFYNRDSEGWYINQMYSPTITPFQFATSYINAKFDPAAEQEFWNSKLGLPFTADGARVTDDDIEKAKRGYKLHDPPVKGFYTMGVDVGTWLHCEIDHWTLPASFDGSVDINVRSRCRMTRHIKVKDFEDLDVLMFEYGINFCVIDGNPERRKATEFANRYPGRVKLCFYGRGVQGKMIHIGQVEPTVTVDRTSWLDLSLGRFRKHQEEAIVIPADTDFEYRSHLKALVRVYEKDMDGNPVARYVKGDDIDHFAHSRNYAEIALPLGLGYGVASTISSPV